VALLSPLLPLADPFLTATDQRLQPPSASAASFHPMGTDGLGRDVASRFIVGAQVTVAIGLIAVTLAALVGVSLGLSAGYAGGAVDRAVMGLTDVQLGIPVLVLILALVSALGPGFANVVIALALSSWVAYARLARIETISVLEREYVQAARALGADTWRIARAHVLPNVRTSLIVLATTQIPQVLLAEASLSFLGLGVQAPNPTWGNLIADGRGYLANAWWISVFPGIALSITTLAIVLLGDWLTLPRGRHR
jgi:peptide/nickel transport system permease protein